MPDALLITLVVIGGRKSGHTNYYHLSEIDHVLQKMKACQDEAELQAYVKEREQYLERLVAVSCLQPPFSIINASTQSRNSTPANAPNGLIPTTEG